jgi:hypothetical protein
MPLGEMKEEQQTYQQQVAATIASLLGEKFEAAHPIAQAISLPATGSIMLTGRAGTK